MEKIMAARPIKLNSRPLKGRMPVMSAVAPNPKSVVIITDPHDAQPMLSVLTSTPIVPIPLARTSLVCRFIYFTRKLMFIPKKSAIKIVTIRETGVKFVSSAPIPLINSLILLDSEKVSLKKMSPMKVMFGNQTAMYRIITNTARVSTIYPGCA